MIELPDDLRHALRESAAGRGVFGARLHYAPEVGSTNDLAAAAAERGAPEGTTFVAGAQTAGRGRLGRSWFSPPGAGLYFSTIIRRASVAPWITLAAGVAVADGIRAATGLPLQIKWPNDIVAVGGTGFKARRKIAGQLAGRAGSIEGELGRPVDAGPILASVLSALHEILADIEVHGPARLRARWLALSPSSHGAPITWDGPAATLTGVTAGIDDDGALLARTAEGVARIIAGEVRWS
jgi:BirA family biotin operon repressor/biotin-[acetyl-CoA-carboxylase] ligase